MLDSKDKEYKSEVLELLKRKSNYLKEMLKITKSTVFKKEDCDQNALNYILMIDKRENIINELKIIDTNLALPKFNQIFLEKPTTEVKELKETIKNIIKEILTIDLTFEDGKNEIMKNFKEKLKQINISKNINRVISQQSDYIVNEGTYFDSKNKYL